MIKKADIILAAGLIIAGLFLSYILSFGQESGSKAEVYADGKLYGVYSLDEDREIAVRNNGHTNIIAIEVGRLYMKSADCSGHDCISQGSISMTGQSIICLPNKVVAQITGGSSGLDAVAR